MAIANASKTVECFDRLNLNGNTDWTLSGSGTGEYHKTVANYDSDSVFYAGRTKLGSGTAGSLTAGQFNLTGTTLTVRLPADTWAGIAGDTDPDSAPSGHVKGVLNGNVASTAFIVPPSTEYIVSQVNLNPVDNTNVVTVELIREESGGAQKAISGLWLIDGADDIHITKFAFGAGEKLIIKCDTAVNIDLVIYQRSTA